MKNKKWLSALVGLVLVLALGFTVVACESDTTGGDDGGDTTVAVTGVELSRNSATLEVGGTLELTATVTPDNATDKEVSWASSAPSVATVEGGTVTAVSVGTASITATAGGINATCLVTVEETGISVATVEELFDAVETAEEGAIIRLTADSYAIDENLHITKSLTLVGNGKTVIEKGTGTWTPDSKGRTSLITIDSASDVTIRNLTVQGAASIGSNYAHGINVYNSTNVTIENVTAQDNDGVGVLVQNSSVSLANVQTSGNGWGGVNVDTGDATNETSLTVDEETSFAETLAIYSDSEAMSEEIAVDLPDSYHGAKITVFGEERYVWTQDETLTEGSFVVNNFADMQSAVSSVQEGAAVYVGGEFELTAPTVLDKAITVKGVEGNKLTIKGTVYAFNMQSGGATLDGLNIEKTDKTQGEGGQNLNLVLMGTDSSVVNCTFKGCYEDGDGEVVRAIAQVAGSENILIEGNTFEALRQPAYLEGSGIVRNNTVIGTRGFVVTANATVELSGNTFENNAVDIAIIPNNQDTNNYKGETVALSAANNNCYVENQPEGVYCNDGQTENQIVAQD